MNRFRLAYLPVLLLTSFLLGQSNPVPLVNSPVVPASATPGGSAFTLEVHGTGFVSGAVLQWNGKPRPTAVVSSSKLEARIQASDIASPKTASITVTNPAPGGGSSNAVPFSVTNPAPVSLTRSDISVLGVASAIVTADLNRDGKIDVVVAQSNPAELGSSAITSFLGKGDGSLRRAQVLTLRDFGSVGNRMDVGDLNGDGILDLAVPLTDNVIKILLGKGDGTFRDPTVAFAGDTSASVVMADFDKDGKLDLAVVNIGALALGNTVSILLGNGDGSFQPAVNYTVGMGPVDLVAGDFNRDGKLDLAVADSNNGGVSILVGNGDGTFRKQRSFVTGPTPRAIATADLNGDGVLDLAVTDLNDLGIGHKASVLLGNGDGTFQPHVDYETGSYPIPVVLADLNGDGRLDLITGNIGTKTSSFSVLLGNGDGTFQPQIVFDTVYPYALAAADFDNDGRIDLLTADQGPFISIQLQTGAQ